MRSSVAAPSRLGPVWLWGVLWFVSYLVTMLFLMTVGLMQRAIELNFENWSYLHVWGMLPFFYFAGVFIARKRYS